MFSWGMQNPILFSVPQDITIDSAPPRVQIFGGWVVWAWGHHCPADPQAGGLPPSPLACWEQAWWGALSWWRVAVVWWYALHYHQREMQQTLTVKSKILWTNVSHISQRASSGFKITSVLVGRVEHVVCSRLSLIGHCCFDPIYLRWSLQCDSTGPG
jgi:hypothetical protein